MSTATLVTSPPTASVAVWLELYRVMFQVRRIDELEAKLVARGEAFFHVSGAGHEGSAVLNYFLNKDDYLHLHYRDKALMLARGIPPEQFFHSLLCNAQSHSLGRQMSAHLSSPRHRILSVVGPVGNNALQAAGVATVLKSQGKDALVVCSMGDGTTQQGEVLEAIGEAVRSKLRVLFFIEDNKYAISTRTQGNTFYSLPTGEASEFYGLRLHRLDGSDPIEAYDGLGQIVESIRRASQPAIVLFQVERLSNHTNADDERRYRFEEEIRRAAELSDPIKNLARHLMAAGVAAEELEELEDQVRCELEASAERTLSIGAARPALEAKKPLPATLTEIAVDAHVGNGESRWTMAEAMREVLRHRLSTDRRVQLLGEDIEDPKGDVFGVTRGLTESFPGRIRNSPLSESTIVGMSIGQALAGVRPVAFIQFADFLPLALNQILCELGTMYWRTAGSWECPVIIMAACGGFRPGLGPFHAQTMESIVAHAPGIDVLMPSNAEDAAGLLNAAFESSRPTVFLYPKVCLNAREHLAPANVSRQLAPIGKARFVTRGCDLTLVSWGATLPICVKVVETLRSAHISVDLIDLRSISPWDHRAVCESANKTGAIAVVHEDNITGGFGGEIIATVCESVQRRVACKRIARADTYIPCRFANQLQVLPSFKRVLAGVSELLGLEVEWILSQAEKGRVEKIKVLRSSPADRTVTLVNWRIKPGDQVATGDIIADLESDKAVSEMACPLSGTVERILVLAGKSVPVGTPVVEICPTQSGARESETVILQRGQPVVKRGKLQASDQRHTRVKVANGLALAGISRVSVAEGSVAVTNEELAAHFPNRTSEEIYRLTGIQTRKHLADGESALSLAATAARSALAREGLLLSDLDAIICSTTTPLQVTPSLACALQAELYQEKQPCTATAFDILAACSGYIYALSSAFDFLQTRPAAKVLLVTAEALSRVVNSDDFETAVLFGDAATATIVYGAANLDRARMLLHRPLAAAKPDLSKVLHVPNPGTGFVQMQGKQVFGEAVRTMLSTLEQACATSALRPRDLALIVPHQANGRIIQAMRARLGECAERVVNLIRDHGNTSSSSIPICLAELDDQVNRGNKLGLCAFGGGFTFGATIVEGN